MGAFDSLRDSIEEAVADKTGKVQRGFDPEVCKGCPHRGDAPLYRCGLCGCPTLEGFPLDRTEMTPVGCPRIPEHERSSGGGEDSGTEFR